MVALSGLKHQEEPRHRDDNLCAVRRDGVSLPRLTTGLHHRELISLLRLLPGFYPRRGKMSDERQQAYHALGEFPMQLVELRHITKNFSDDQLVGEGTFGKVYKGVLTNGDVIAVKRFASTITGLQDGQYENEAEHLMWLEHPNIVQLVGYCSETQTKLVRLNGKFVRAEQSERLLCLEYMPKGSLRGHLSDESSGLDWKTRYNIIKGICYGLHYLHEERQATPIIHMDLKPANILLDDNMVPKIADFGLSRLFGEEQTRTCTTSCKGTLGYMAPEYLEKGVITKKFDIFSLGVIIIEIITGLKGYPTEETKTTSQQYIDMVLNNWRHRSKDIDYQQINKCIQIGLLCVKFDGAKRPTIDQIIKMLERSDEAYKNEREDAYALCRVFKKTQPGPKIIEHYGAVHHPIEQPQWMGSSVDRSPTLDMSSDVRGDDFESSSFLFPTEAPMDSMHGGFGMQMSAPHEDGKWMQFLSEDAFNATNPFFMNPASSSFSCLPSKVDVALECARLQHRLSLPPLEVEDFPQDVSLDTKTSVLRSNPNEVDILQEFLSVALASQELINGTSSSYATEMWPGAGTSSTSTHYINELSSLVELGVKAKEEADNFYHMDCIGTSAGFASKPVHVDEPVRLVEIADMEEFKQEEKRQIENLRGVKLQNNDLLEIVVGDESNPTDCVTQYPISDTADNSNCRRSRSPDRSH